MITEIKNNRVSALVFVAALFFPAISYSGLSGGGGLSQEQVSANPDVAANKLARHGAVTLGTANGLSLSTQSLSLQSASASQPGALTASDWNTFNAKQAAMAILQGTYHVDKGGTDSGSCGGVQAPCLTIQQALTNIGNSASVADVKSPKTVLIGGGAYDESLTIPRGRVLSLIAQGTVVLGNGSGTNWSSTVARSITATFDNADVFGTDVKPALNIGHIMPGDATSTFLAEASGFFISGNLNIAGDGLSHTVNLHGVKLQGTLTKTATGLTNLQAYRTVFVGAVNAGTATILERCVDCEFGALVTVDGYNSITGSEIKAGMTVTTNFNTLPPSGMFFTTFTGTFTGPASSLKLDPVSAYYFTANGAALGGSATKVLLSSSFGISYTPTTSANWTTAPTTSGGALDQIASGKFTTQGVQLATSGTLPSCDSSRRGLLWNIQGGAGVADVLQICQKDVADAYVWVTK